VATRKKAPLTTKKAKMATVKETKSGKTVCKEALVCSSIWKKARGLILSKRKNLIFVFPDPSRVSLHMVGVLYPIDVVGLDTKKRVVSHARLKPLQIWRSPAEVQYIIELSKQPYQVPKLGTQLKF